MALVTATTTLAVSPLDKADRKIEDESKSCIPKELQSLFDSANKEFNAKSYKTAAKYYKNAIDFLIFSVSSLQNIKATDNLLILTKYMLSMCWLESTDSKELTDALNILEDLEENYASAYPMLYCALAKAYFKLYSFKKADEILKKGFAMLNAVKPPDLKVVECFMPGTNIVIPESSKDRLVAALAILKDQCSSWHRSDAICSINDCINDSTISYKCLDKNIFYGSPTFNGMVQVTCNNPSNFCTLRFHPACWTEMKKTLGELGKKSDKEVIHMECFTPNCENQGVRCTIKKVEIFDEHAQVKATIPSKLDSVQWHGKSPSTPKGAIRKQQQTQKKFVTNESRPQLERNTRGSSVPHEQQKSNGTEEDEEAQADQRIKLGIERLKELRARNFGVKNDMIWRPNLPMYGNSYMLETAGAFPDPEFLDDDPEEQKVKSFVFSWFYTLISNDGPIKLKLLEEKWNEAKNMIKNYECILRDHLNISEFLTESLKFAIVGDYICTAENLPEAYKLTKSDTCDTLKFFMNNDVDEHSNSSSIDDEVVFNDFKSGEKNRASNSSMSESDKSTWVQSTVATSMPIDNMKKDEMPTKFTESKNYSTEQVDIREKANKPETSAKINVESESQDFIEAPATASSVSNCKNGTHKESIISDKSENSIGENNKKIVQKRSHSPESSHGNPQAKSEEKIVCKIQKENYTGIFDSQKVTINGVYSVQEIEQQVKSNKDMDTFISLLENIHGSSANLNSETDKQPESVNASGTSKFIDTSVPDIMAKSQIEVNTYHALKDDTSRMAKLAADTSLELAVTKEELERLKSKLAHLDKVHSAERGRMMQRILHERYAYSQCLIDTKLSEWRKNYEFITGLQQLLDASISETLPINLLEWWKIIMQLEKISKNLQEKFTNLNDELSKNPQMEKFCDINMFPDEIPKFPKVDFIEIIKSAFGLYRMYQMKEFQKLQLMPQSQPPPQSLPQIQGPPVYAPPQFGQPLEYYQPNLSSRNRGMFYPVSPQPPFMHSPMPQPISFATPPSLLTPLPILRQVHPPHGQQHSSNFTKNPQYPAGAYQKNNSPTQQHIFASMQQNASNYHHVRSPVPDVQNILYAQSRKEQNAPVTPAKIDALPNYSNPVGKNDTTQQNFSHLTNGRTTSQTDIQPGQIATSIAGELKNVSSQQSNHRNDYLMKNPQNSVSSSTETMLSSNSYSANSQNEIHTRITQEAQHRNLHGNPDIVMKKNTHGNAVKMENKLRKTNGHSIDKLMRRLRSQHKGVLELDLLKAVECVRKMHGNSLSNLPMLQIISEAEKFITARQQKQLCGYWKHQSNLCFAFTKTNPWLSSEAEKKKQSSVSSSSAVNSSKKEQQGSLTSLTHSKKQWEPVTNPNDKWVKETVESECVICMEPMLIANQLYTLQCKHTFHKTCITIWYRQNQSCPTCRVHSTIDDEYPPLPLG